MTKTKNHKKILLLIALAISVILGLFLVTYNIQFAPAKVVDSALDPTNPFVIGAGPWYVSFFGVNVFSYPSGSDIQSPVNGWVAILLNTLVIFAVLVAITMVYYKKWKK